MPLATRANVKYIPAPIGMIASAGSVAVPHSWGRRRAPTSCGQGSCLSHPGAVGETPSTSQTAYAGRDDGYPCRSVRRVPLVRVGANGPRGIRHTRPVRPMLSA